MIHEPETQCKPCLKVFYRVFISLFSVIVFYDRSFVGLLYMSIFIVTLLFSFIRLFSLLWFSFYLYVSVRCLGSRVVSGFFIGLFYGSFFTREIRIFCGASFVASFVAKDTTRLCSDYTPQITAEPAALHFTVCDLQLIHKWDMTDSLVAVCSTHHTPPKNMATHFNTLQRTATYCITVT